jgi:hypothetical protein
MNGLIVPNVLMYRTMTVQTVTTMYVGVTKGFHRRLPSMGMQTSMYGPFKLGVPHYDRADRDNDDRGNVYTSRSSRVIDDRADGDDRADHADRTAWADQHTGPRPFHADCIT